MPSPVPGQNYTVVKGDTLWDLSIAAYGDPWRWKEIYDANEVELTPKTPNKWGYIMHPGDVIFIPGNTVVEALKEESVDLSAEGADKNEMTIVIDSEKVPITGGRILRTMDTPADGFTASTYFDVNWERHQRIFKPLGFQKALAYLGEKTQVTGRLYKPIISSSEENGDIAQLHCFSPTIDIVDSTAKPPYSQNNVTLEERIRTLVEPKGIRVLWRVDGATEKFRKVKMEKTEFIWDHLKKLAMQRAVVISSDTAGNLVCDNVSTTGTIGTLTPGDGLYLGTSGGWDGRKQYFSYTAYGTGPKKNLKAVSKNNGVPRSRMLAFSANDTDSDSIQKAADNRRNLSASEALSIPLPVSSWYGPDGELWTPNTLVTLVDPRLFLPDGFTFLIKSVEFVYGATEGSPATVTVVPPSVYTGEELVNPWA